MSFFNSLTIAAILMSTAAQAAVLPERRQVFCNPPEKQPLEYQNLKSSAPFKQPPVMGSPVFCVSNLEDNCELSQGIAHTITIQHTITVGINGGIDIGKIFSLGASVGYEYSWSASDETSYGDTQLCPAGGLECGVIATAKVVTVSGQTRRVVEPGCGPEDTWQDFAFTAPFKEKVEGPKQTGSTTFRTCVQSCGSPEFPNSCDPARTMPICPSADPGLKNFLGHFGGTPGYIPIEEAGF